MRTGSTPPKGMLQYIRYFCWEDIFNEEELKDNEQKRLALYKYTASLIRAYANIANEMAEAGYTPKELRISSKMWIILTTSAEK